MAQKGTKTLLSKETAMTIYIVLAVLVIVTVWLFLDVTGFFLYQRDLRQGAKGDITKKGAS